MISGHAFFSAVTVSHLARRLSLPIRVTLIGRLRDRPLGRDGMTEKGVAVGTVTTRTIVVGGGVLSLTTSVIIVVNWAIGRQSVHVMKLMRGRRVQQILPFLIFAIWVLARLGKSLWPLTDLET